MNRKVLTVIVLAVCLGVGAVVVVLVQPADRRPGVEKRVRRLLTRPGPDQVAPDGERPKTVDCHNAGEKRWTCRVSYPSGLRLVCLVGERRLDQELICQSPQSRLPSVLDLPVSVTIRIRRPVD